MGAGGASPAGVGGRVCAGACSGSGRRPPCGSSDPRRLLSLQNFLFHVYGLMLRESPGGDVVRKHLAGLLELSHASASQRAGIALAVGIAAATHMELVWALLEHVGRTKFLRAPHTSSASQGERHSNPNLHWKWVGSTSLLCYGQMAMRAQKQILPWVDNIASRMVYYYSSSSYDHILRKSFLSAAVMLMKALKRESSAQGYKFRQTAELVHCLLFALQKEPDYLVSTFRQKIILVIAGLSSLRPSLTPTVKSTILQTCFQSLYQLPPIESLRSRCPPPKSDPMVLYQKAAQALNLLLQTFILENKSMDEVCFLLQHTEPWLTSDRSEERERAVQTIFLLLKCMVECVKLTEEARPSVLGHQIGLLMLLWWDRVEFTKSHARLCVCLLLQLLVQQKGNVMEFIYLNKMKHFEEKVHKDLDVTFYHLVQAVDDHLTVAQHTQLILTLLRALSNPKHADSDLASQLLLMVFEDHSIKPEQVAEILQGLFQELPAISFKNVQQTVLRAVTVLGTQHTQETVEVLLSLCHPSERQVAPLWKALASNNQLARKVMTLLYIKLKLRPPQLLVRLSEQSELMSMLALGTIYELLYIREYKAIVHWAFAGILLGLLTQLHYLFELGVVESIPEPQEDVLDMKPLGPCSTCLEALKGLFWTTNYWEVFAYLKLLRGWELFGHVETYTEGVTLLARAMAHYDCEVKAVLGQAVICLKSAEERDNIVAILIITEFLNSQELTQYMTRKTMNKFLTLGLTNPSHLVRALSLTGLSSVLMQPKKLQLLRTRMLVLVDSFQKPEPKDLLGLMEILGDTLHRMGPQGVGACSLKLAQRLRQLFENEQEEVRGGAILLYGDVIYSGGRKYQQALKGHAFQSLVPLLFHLADTCPQVVMKTKFTFLRCAILLNWEFRKQLFSKLAWGRGLSAESDIFMCMVESNFGSCHLFLLQAAVYLRSPHKNLKRTAMKFIGGILQDYFTNLCFYLKRSDMKLFRTQFEVLKQEQDSASRRFYRNFLHEVLELSRYVSQ
ncbi:hypothetical protein QTO34_007529 [Cnephaeus nilssonii]|uniref:Maestro heat-like repeat family member 5 n=1 Tax=Cnephaeus nilssonii TaxID=3371016 RepID=A0AA40HIM9_CNENI|nr:hypothetical protein QTO34_007529 [Eptesicus nilssonii]